MSKHPRSFRTASRHARGFSLIELMVALVVSLLVVAAAGGIFISNKRTYNTTETLGRIQENGRVAFELMAREVREAGGTPCGKNIPIANVLNDPGAGGFDYAWGDGINGYDGGEAVASVAFGTTPGLRVAGTDALEFKAAANSGVTVSKHVPASATIFTNTTEHGFVAGDILLICDYSQATIFQMSGPNAGGTLQVVHNTGNGTPGNSCKALSFPVDPDCAAKPKDGKQYADNAVIAKFSSSVWYIGFNDRGGRSLFRKVLNGASEEVTEGVEDMQLAYLVPGQSNYLVAASVDDTKWKDVTAVRIDLQLRAAAGALSGNEIRGTNADGTSTTTAIGRTLSHVVTLRNRVP